MIKRMLGAPLGGTTRGGQYGLESKALSLITPPNGMGGGGICLPSIVTVALGAPGVPLICWAGAGKATNIAPLNNEKPKYLSLCFMGFVSVTESLEMMSLVGALCVIVFLVGWFECNVGQSTRVHNSQTQRAIRLLDLGRTKTI